MAENISRDDLMDQVKQQIALVNAQELLSVKKYVYNIRINLYFILE